MHILRSILFMSFSICTLNSWSQTLFVKKEFCKKSEIEIVAGNCIPANYALIGTGSFLKSEEESSLENLSKKQLNQIRKYGKMFKSCKMFVDFDTIVKWTDKNGENINENKSLTGTLRPRDARGPAKEFGGQLGVKQTILRSRRYGH